MKKIIGTVLLCMGLGSSLFAQANINEKVSNKDYKNTKEFMNATKNVSLNLYEIINDYFQAKTCKEDFTDSVSIEEIREFAASEQYGFLMVLKYKEKEPMSKATYLALNSAYKYMNCGGEDNLGGFIGSTSAMAVELDSKETK